MKNVVLLVQIVERGKALRLSPSLRKRKR